MQPTEFPSAITEHIRAVNAHDTDAIMASFAPDAFVNDARREYVGAEAIRGWVQREIVGDNVTYQLLDAQAHGATTVIRVQTDGDYDKTNLPDPLVLTGYLTVGAEGIEQLIMIHNQASPA